MNKLLQALGLMRVSEHERIAASLKREDWKGVAFGFEANFKKAITDLAAAREEVAGLNEKIERKAVLNESAEATINYLRGEINRLTPDALAMRRKRERDRERRKGKVS